MMKLVFLVTIYVLGSILCETHDQQKEYANKLIAAIEGAEEGTKEMLKHYDVNTQDGKHLILLHANSFNYNLHFVLDCLQYFVIRNKEQEVLQEVVFKLNDITHELQQSFRNDVSVVKSNLQSSVEKVVIEAKNLQKIIQESSDPLYRTTVSLFLDDLVTVIETNLLRDVLRRIPNKRNAKSNIQISRNAQNKTLSNINSTNVDLHKDITRYSSKFTSTISEAKSILRALSLTYETKKEGEVKEIIYSLSKIIQDNEEVLHKESSFQEILDQFRLTLLNFADQLDKIVDAGFSDDHTIEDENLIYIALPKIFGQSIRLQRNLIKTIHNYVHPDSNE